MFKKINVRVALAAASMLALGQAHAASTLDTSAVTSAAGDIATVGGLVFAVVVAIKALHWVRRAL